MSLNENIKNISVQKYNITIKEHIGSGMMGDVYIVILNDNPTEYVLKFNKDPYKEMIEKEFKIHSKASMYGISPKIIINEMITAIDTTSDEQMYGILMEKMDNTLTYYFNNFFENNFDKKQIQEINNILDDLDIPYEERKKQEEKLKAEIKNNKINDDFKSVIRQLVTRYHELFKLGIIFRDPKSCNILYRIEDGHTKVYISDYGIALERILDMDKILSVINNYILTFTESLYKPAYGCVDYSFEYYKKKNRFYDIYLTTIFELAEGYNTRENYNRIKLEPIINSNQTGGYDNYHYKYIYYKRKYLHLKNIIMHN